MPLEMHWAGAPGQDFVLRVVFAQEHLAFLLPSLLSPPFPSSSLFYAFFLTVLYRHRNPTRLNLTSRINGAWEIGPPEGALAQRLKFVHYRAIIVQSLAS